MSAIDRRKLMAGAAIGTAAVTLAAVPAFGAVGEDAELRELWARYLVQLEAYKKGKATIKARRAPYDAEFKSLRDQYPRAYGELHNRLWKKHGLEPLSVAWEREGRKLRRIVSAIRHAKAESLFGIGVKLSVTENPLAVDDLDLALAIDDARRDIAALIGADFIAATGTATGALDT